MSRHQSKFIQQLVMEVFYKVDNPISNNEEKLLGIYSCVDTIKSLLELGTNDVRFIEIWGMSETAKIHYSGLLSVAESVELFHLKAFKKIHQPKEFKEHSGLIEKHAGGLPSALKVLVHFYLAGTLKCGKGIGVSVLIEKSLIVISEGKLHMHDLIQEMGWHIVRQVHPSELRKYNRLWDPEEVCDVSTENMGQAVEGLQLDLPKPKSVDFSSDALRKILKVPSSLECSELGKLSKFLGNLGCLEELHTDRIYVIQLPPSIGLMLKKLKILSLHGRKNSIVPDHPLCFGLPLAMGLSSLEKLYISNLNLTELSSEISCLLSSFEFDIDGNDFVNLPSSMTEFSQLLILWLAGCKKLQELPKLPLSVEELYADDCELLQDLADPLPMYTKLSTILTRQLFHIGYYGNILFNPPL
ncbi:hypothetical protein RJ640_009728 [Escallonia rubra]|uniref:Disease resistance protein Roq1-like winged-helix domain-containing protein n=1 Tax=Escallonia rubra TaxID=112253 RepID=A0AA88U6X8_9ASTE|nr:hypothetical protein RJ640_009728 [Escallonia rubra]